MGIDRGRVRIGIDAPDEVNILREELYQRGVRSIRRQKYDVETKK